MQTQRMWSLNEDLSLVEAVAPLHHKNKQTKHEKPQKTKTHYLDLCEVFKRYHHASKTSLDTELTFSLWVRAASMKSSCKCSLRKQPHVEYGTHFCADQKKNSCISGFNDYYKALLPPVCFQMKAAEEIPS